MQNIELHVGPSMINLKIKLSDFLHKCFLIFYDCIYDNIFQLKFEQFLLIQVVIKLNNTFIKNVILKTLLFLLLDRNITRFSTFKRYISFFSESHKTVTVFY